MKEDEDDNHRKQMASHSRRVMEVVGFLPEQKVTTALRMLAYGVSVDQVDKIMRMEKSTVLESLMQFCSAIKALYMKEYLHKQTLRDLQRLLRKGAKNDLNVLAQSPVFDEVLSAARMFDVEALRSIMMTCIVLHNMIVEDDYDYDAVDGYESDTMNKSRTRIYCAHDGTEDPV
ncbi:uncharacterized protein [Malus domestica]|uniref:uncharacterized protein n=1 Tax=Malus domestica TaxID=3750 RepID=UPI0004989716|nr:uncharacterized protein LOC103403326 [Malus domestica]